MTHPAALLGPVHHVGFVVRNVDSTESLFDALGYRRLRDGVEDPVQDAEIVFLARKGAAAREPLVELICPRSEQSPVYAFSRESRFRIHHLCFAVEDIEAAAAASVANRRVHHLTAIMTAPAIGGHRIVFLFSRETGLFELVERPPF
jgi:catechol 2,3-dioxygenase-like lactoylglutathione lyase family enzyme